MAGAATHAHDDHRPKGWIRWVYSTNHKDIGTLYLIFAIIAGIIGGGLSVMMRWELQEPGIQVFHGLAQMVYGYDAAAATDAGKELFNVFVSAHGLIMGFFMVMPAVIGGFGNWMTPIMIGTPDMAFPLLNNITFWWLRSACRLMLLSRFVPGDPCGYFARTGWTLYPPLWFMGQHVSAVVPAIVAVRISGASRSLGTISSISPLFILRASSMT